MNAKLMGVLNWVIAVNWNPFLAPIRSNPEFEAAAEIVRADLVAQREWLREKAANGELAPLPQ